MDVLEGLVHFLFSDVCAVEAQTFKELLVRLPLAPKDRAARATDTLRGEKKTFLD
uniref:Uncharacterized protein n=1 Tax=Anguilla anguilla TaxID=7936 RepID=A0A0E9RVK4_ANGAN